MAYYYLFSSLNFNNHKKKIYKLSTSHHPPLIYLKVLHIKFNLGMDINISLSNTGQVQQVIHVSMTDREIS